MTAAIGVIGGAGMSVTDTSLCVGPEAYVTIGKLVEPEPSKLSGVI